MPDFVYRKGTPALDDAGNVQYIQPIRTLQHTDGIWYPGVYNPEGFVYNKVPSDYIVMYSPLMDGNMLQIVDADGLNVMVRG